jgi:hypothetical protein
MPDITISYATIGGARLAITNNRTRDNDASTLFTSYADTTKAIATPATGSFGYNMVATLAGLPLSISLFTDPDRDPSSSINQIAMFYALDIIENSDPEDSPLDPSIEGNIPTNPSDKTFTWNGNRLSASKKSERYYMNIVDSGNTGNATQQVILAGVPMAQGLQNELILNKTAYTTSDIDEYEIIGLGGSPLTVGRIGNDYYLVVSPILAGNA